ncbi:MAG TPA: hypothetical protein VG938_16975 [Verrucomicrobiae bacterium]|jgi:hypothetical protein|nr:hypothetical protein [Verrucomicrobiae bacterium]
MKMDEFEKHLQRQPLRKVPGEWREEILRAAASTRPSPVEIPPSFLSTLTHQLSTILWPHPRAWAGLGCVWILIFALHFATQDGSPRMASRTPPPSPEVMVAFRNQQKLMTELIGNNEPQEMERPKSFPAQPHSERCKNTSMA